MGAHTPGRFWAAATRRRPQLWIGPGGKVPEAPPGRRTIRVRCDRPAPPLAPLRAAQAQAARLLGGRTAQTERSRRLTAGPRLHLLADDPQPHPVEALRSTLRQVEATHPGLTLVLDGLDGADRDTARFAASLLAGAPWPVAVALGVADTTAGVGATLAAAVGTSGGVAGAPAPEPRPIPASWSSLPPTAHRAAQALAIVDGPVPARVLADLLGRTPLRLLEDLQAAIDAGVPIDDLGDGVVSMPPAVASELRRALMPSLARAWRTALVDLLDPPSLAATTAAAPEAAATQLHALGARLEAATRLVRAAEDALAHHAHGQAQDLVHRGVELLADIGESDERDTLLARLLDLGAAAVHVQAGSGDADLGTALALADRAWAALPPDSPPALSAQLRARAAAICYDRGDKGSLERALGELTEAIRELQAAGQARGAARLLNDQAAVWVRLGDPVRAAGLLDRSRAVFSAVRDPSQLDEAEAAETLHLLARLPLHVPARQGVAEQAAQAALEHARDARRIYQRIDQPRAAARVQETMGRLALRTHDLTEALALLAGAAREQQASADALGLARTTAALAEAVGQDGDTNDAIELLATSMALNHRVGSGGGLRINRAALDALPGNLPAVARLRQTADQLLADLEGP